MERRITVKEVRDSMDVKDFYYELPQELIAQDPLEDRSSSRLLVLKKGNGEVEHTSFRHIIDYLEPGDCLVLNNTKVIPARLFGEREGTGGKVELLLLKRRENDVWETLVKPGKKARPGTKILFGGGLLTGEVQDIVEDGNRLVKFSYEGIFEEILDKLGQMPLPPYITHKLLDKNRYQTVYAKEEGSAAAPTAGLHFTPELLAQIREKGISIAEVTLHVGLGTFRPVKTEQVQDHHMHFEFYQISEEAAGIINETKRRGGRVVCVGTTSCRTVESAARDLKAKRQQEGMLAQNGEVRERILEEGLPAQNGEVREGVLEEGLPSQSGNMRTGDVVQAGSGWTDIFIYPGYQFQVLDALITNFHLPESTLVMLVSALAGREQVLRAYRIAVEEKYRFFSFGDAMLVV